MNDKSYLESQLYETNSITLNAILSIKNQEYQNITTYMKQNREGILPVGTWI